ncbi:3-isopropylmalate dehydrogenase [Propioniferax innocua]|uniref:3-isopropylmalate dehydrogenase n=1 Tax=Propioniferax innocua TaxID=1753 RepID=A0A542Z7E6_9ACTN|nr:3-isopropylmalate dehydrogenase [Propioniferax innocua]
MNENESVTNDHDTDAASIGAGDSGTRSVNIAVIGGDGIGPEVTREAVKVLGAAVGTDAFTTTEFDLGADRYRRDGEIYPADDIAELAKADAILLGAVGAEPGATDVPSGLVERGFLLRLRFAFDHYVNLRPARLFPGVDGVLSESITNEAPIDLVVVREGTEGLYCGNGGVVRAGTPHEIATEVSVNTAFGVERVVRDAFARAAARNGHLTLLHKHNVLVNAGGLWRRVVAEVGAEYPDVTVDYAHIDAAMIHLVTDPARFDVIVTDNLFGDIVTDLAGAVTGGIGLAASGNINPTGAFPSMFEPVHGSAPDIAGRGLADPTAAILSAALLAEHLRLGDAASQIRDAVAAHLASGPGSLTTSQIGDAIADRLG